MTEYRGLTDKTAQELLSRYGENTLHKKSKTSAFLIFANQFRDALIMILLAATLISLFMGEITEAVTISAIIVINSILGFVQEYRTEKTLEKLNDLASPTATVIRNGYETQLNAKLVVPGDLLKISAGDRIPADGVVLSAVNLSCDESMLSGESTVVEKTQCTSEENQDNKSSVYMGTLVTHGKAFVRVKKTGDSTEMGKIAGMLNTIHSSPTPLQLKLNQLSKYIGIACLVICAVVALVGILRGEPIFDMLLIGISLSVAAVPEGLPAIVTVSLALSVNRMVKRRALIRRLHAVETLGCANIICSDKTGTLTENRMTVTEIYLPDKALSVSGVGLETDGIFLSDGKNVDTNSVQLKKLLTVATVCNNASISSSQKTFSHMIKFKKPPVTANGEPTEIALLVCAAKGGLHKDESTFNPIHEEPFDSVRKRMSVLAKSKDGFELFVKGAPDILIRKCTHYLSSTGVKKLDTRMTHRILTRNNSMAENALRVLALAYRPSSGKDDIAEDNLIFVGLAGILDPPRKEAYKAVKKCKTAGIRTVMITGDHAITARAIATKLGICTENSKVLTGADLDTLSQSELIKQLPEVSVFARVTPAHKLKIVQAFKSRGDIVAMTGDGVNDAPAVKESDIGVAMGKTGTDVTKEASSVILLDDNFATLVSAIEEGRIIYSNIRKFIRYLLSCNIGEVITMFLAMLLGFPVPLIPIQILLINLITDSLPAISLGLEPAQTDTMEKLPRGKNESIFSNGLSLTIIVRGILIGITTLVAFYTMYKSTGDLNTGRTAALFALILTQLIHVFECKSETHGIVSVKYFNNIPLLLSVILSLVFVIACIYIKPLSHIFCTVSLSAKQLLTIIAYCSAVPVINSIFLSVRRKFYSSSL